jgi:hypothetical protein
VRTSEPDRDLLYRVKDVGDALAGIVEEPRLSAILSRLVAAADHLGAAQVGSVMADHLATTEGLNALIGLFGQGDRALDMAALYLGAVSVHSAVDLCASVVLIATQRWTPGTTREPGINELSEQVKKLSTPWQQWWFDSDRAELAQLKQWRNPLVHSHMPTSVVGEPSSNGGLVRGSVRVSLVVRDEDGHEVEQFLGSAKEMLPRFVRFGEERLLAIGLALRTVFANR